MAPDLDGPSHYDLLGVSEDASTTQIGKAFMRAMRTAHPDQHHDEPAADLAAAEEHARLLTEAHQTLTGEDRAAYDDELRAARRARGAGQPAPHPEVPVHTPPPSRGSTPSARRTERLGFWDSVTGDDEETVLRLPRERWERGGTLRPFDGGQAIVIPERVGHEEVLVFTGRGRPGRGGEAPGDLLVRILHVDDRGHELAGGHTARAGWAGRASGLGGGLAAAVAFVLVVAAALIAAILTLG